MPFSWMRARSLARRADRACRPCSLRSEIPSICPFEHENTLPSARTRQNRPSEHEYSFYGALGIQQECWGDSLRVRFGAFLHPQRITLLASGLRLFCLVFQHFDGVEIGSFNIAQGSLLVLFIFICGFFDSLFVAD